MNDPAINPPTTTTCSTIAHGKMPLIGLSAPGFWAAMPLVGTIATLCGVAVITITSAPAFVGCGVADGVFRCFGFAVGGTLVKVGATLVFVGAATVAVLVGGACCGAGV